MNFPYFNPTPKVLAPLVSPREQSPLQVQMIERRKVQRPVPEPEAVAGEEQFVWDLWSADFVTIF